MKTKKPTQQKLGPQRQLDVLIAFRGRQSDHEAVLRVAVKLDLDPAEISRRALRIGLDILNRTKLPGTDLTSKLDEFISDHSSPHSPQNRGQDRDD